MITLHRKDDVWVQHFRSFKQMLEQACQETILAIEHIGSTSVPGLQAKDIVDVQLGVRDLNAIEPIRGVLSPMGFEYIESFRQDHMPFKAHDELAEGWEKRFLKGVYQGQAFNVHIRVFDAANWHYAIDFRDYLIKDKQACKAYEQVKERLAQAKVSQYDYTHVKDPVCDLVYLLFEQAKQHEQKKTNR